jgi:transcriptional regulator with XRE-family HTH domain
MLTMGERIARMRQRRGMTPSELARRANIPLSTLSVIERGKRKGEGLTVATAKRIAEALGVSLDYLSGMYEDDDAGTEIWAAAMAVV